MAGQSWWRLGEWQRRVAVLQFVIPVAGCLDAELISPAYLFFLLSPNMHALNPHHPLRPRWFRFYLLSKVFLTPINTSFVHSVPYSLSPIWFISLIIVSYHLPLALLSYQVEFWVYSICLISIVDKSKDIHHEEMHPIFQNFIQKTLEESYWISYWDRVFHLDGICLSLFSD